MAKCEVKFDNNPNGIFYSGQILSGVVELTNEKSRKIRGLSLRIEGFAKCKWTESEGTGKNRRTVTYHGREDYMNTFSYLVPSFEVTQAEFAAGLHKFNFSCQLPPQLPTSFESKYGHIRYQVKVEIERPWKFDIKYCFAFTVLKVLDLNFESPALRSPLKTEVKKNFFFGLGSKTLFVSAEIPSSGYVAGQSVKITVTINNESNVDVEEIKISLKKFIHYNSQSPRRKTRERVESAAEVRHAGITGKNKGNIEAQLTLPAVPPTNTAFCSVLQVSYEIHIQAKVGGIHRSPYLRLPITMGTVPLQGYQFSAPTLINSSNWQLQPGSSTAPYPPQPSLYPHLPPSQVTPSAPMTQDLPPPSYHQAMGMQSYEADNDDGLNDEKPFSPMYPMYNFNQPNAPPSEMDPPPAYGYTSPTSYNEKRGF